MDPATGVIVAAFLGGPTVGVLVNRFLPARTSPIERIEKLENDFRMLQDYTHDLRQHIAAELPPPPPPWPAGLTQ